MRMLVPVVDMLNHAGDEYEPGRGGVLGAAARDNVRCVRVGGWEKGQAAREVTAPVAQGWLELA